MQTSKKDLKPEDILRDTTTRKKSVLSDGTVLKPDLVIRDSDIGKYQISWEKGTKLTEIEPDHDFLPAIPKEFTHGASDEFLELLRRALKDGTDSLDPDDQRRLQIAKEQFPEIAEAFRKREDQENQPKGSIEQRFIERTKDYFTQATRKGPLGVARAVDKTVADFVSEIGSPLVQYFEEQKALTPHPVSPDRDYAKEPLTVAEENYQRLSGPDKMLAWSDYIASSATGSIISFFTQSLDPIVNPEKYNTNSYEAISEVSSGLTDMIAQAPDQISHIAEAVYGTRDNPVSKLVELAGTILQAPKLVLGKKDREELHREAVNSFYKNPEGLPFAVMIVKGVYNKATKGLKKPFDRLAEEPKPTEAKAPTEPPPVTPKPKVAETPEAVAKEFGIKYEGLQERPIKGIEGKMIKDAEGEFVMEHLYSFTDPKTGSTFFVKELSEAAEHLSAMREKFAAAKKPKPEPISEVGDLREGMSVFIQLPKHRKPKPAKITSLATDEAGKPVRVQVRYSGKIKGKMARVETTLTPEQIQIPEATLKLREYHKALSYVPKKERPAVAQKARDFDVLLRDNIERFLDEPRIEELLAEETGTGAKAEALSIARVLDEARLEAETALGLSGLKNPVKRAEALGKLQEWLKKQEPQAAPEMTVLGDLNLKEGDKVKMSGEWFKVEPSETPGNIKLTDGRTLDIEDTFTRLPVEAVSRTGKEEIISPTEQRAAGFALPKLSDKFTRELKEARKKRGEPAEIPSMVIERAPKDVGLTSAIRTPTNLFDAIPVEPAGTGKVAKSAYWYRDMPMKEPRYGRAAQQSSLDLALSERDIMIEVGQRAEFLDAVLHEAKKDKKTWGEKGEGIYDHIVDPTRDVELSTTTLEAVKTVRKEMIKVRDEVIRRRREQLRPSVTEITNREWRTERGLKGKKLTDAQRSERDAAVETAIKDRVPDDWGIENYLPQMHPGDWSVWAEIDGVKTFIGAARTPTQAITRAMDHYGKHPELTPEGYRVTGRAFRGWDVLRVTQAKLWRTMGEIAKQAEDALSPEQVRDALRGVIGAKEARQKYAGFLQQRKGYEGYRKDIMGVLSVFNQNFVRWKHLTDLNKVIQPRLRQIRAEGRPNTANEIEAIFTHLWGRTPSKISKLMDASIQRVPGIRDYVRPMAYERSLGRVKGGVVLTFLKINPRFNLLNRLQRYQTTLPILRGLPHTAEWRAGTKFYGSPEGHAALDQFGIKHLTGGKFLEGGRTLTKPKSREKLRSLAPETSNQEIAWATMFDRAKKFGFSDLAANDYAFLKGNVYTQFVHLSTDVPALLRGPTMSTIMQFKRFPIKNVELGIDLIADRNYPGVAKWIGAQILLGGAKIATSPVRVIGGASAAWITAKTYQEIKEKHGEYLADVVAWGLPALVGLDMSYSFQLIDTPWGQNVPEKIGNFFMGPSGNVVYSAARSAISDKGLETSRFDRALKSVTQRVPGLKFVDALRTLAEGLDRGEYRFEDPAGRVKFKGDLKDVIVKGLGGRTLEEARIELLTEAATQINEQRDKVLNQIANTFVEKRDFDFKAREDWNEMWPEFPIDNEAIIRRMRARLETKDLDRYQRMMKTLPKIFRPAFYKYDEEKMWEALR